MKTPLVLFALAFASPAFASTASSNLSQPIPAPASFPEKPFTGPLQLSVNLPASLREASITDEIEQNVGDFLADALRQQGFAGKIEYLGSGYEPERNRPLLEINLLEWRRDLTGAVNCTFTATISTAKGREDLGLFSGSGLIMAPRGDWFARGNAFEDAIRTATTDLYQRMEKSHLL